MPPLLRLAVLCPLSRRRGAPVVFQFRSRLIHSNPGRQSLSAANISVGVVVFFTAFLTPMAWVLHHLNQFRRH
ncbi:cytochrome c oxidase subunit 8C, mitochondrial [Tamandua tetradactyla]|uniref:cytochrome c oxidase subunit 8C, mitochondrial n=1 Tax=Tamandua tetradactyla TaxID=48850 RepID=UPI0040548860